jgi:K+-transporting ATPase ATPase A chain
MIGRTPGYLRKKLRPREMKLIALYIVVAPMVILAGTGLAAALPAGRASIGDPGPHGLSEILYAFVSSTNGNGSAFASLAGDTGFCSTALALAMLLGGYLPMILVLALAASFAAQRPVVADGSSSRGYSRSLPTGVAPGTPGIGAKRRATTSPTLMSAILAQPGRPHAEKLLGCSGTSA